jgi:hypothetical protein
MPERAEEKGAEREEERDPIVLLDLFLKRSSSILLQLERNLKRAIKKNKGT